MEPFFKYNIFKRGSLKLFNNDRLYSTSESFVYPVFWTFPQDSLAMHKRVTVHTKPIALH